MSKAPRCAEGFSNINSTYDIILSDPNAYLMSPVLLEPESLLW